MDIESTYIVEYIQVNINAGDCEIVLLLEEDKNKVRTVKYSVMIDGGMGHRIPMENIKRVFESLATRYGAFKLDAIVISHWDEDHYKGVLKFLKNNLDNRGRVFEFLKYDNLEPLSTLYIPYVFHHSEQGLLYSETEPGIGKFGFNHAKHICKYRADIPMPMEELLNKEPLEWDVFSGEPEHESELIGRNLFTDERPALTKLKGATSPKDLVLLHGTLQRDPGAPKEQLPGLYCVAANNRYLKGKKKRKPGVKMTSTQRNRGSVVCMVIRPIKGIVTHYLAGDAFQELELRIMDWTGFTTMTKPTTGNPKIEDRIAIVKASHHGATTSTPVTMCQTYKPQYFILSAGGMHRHPSWEVLLYVYSYYKWLLGNNTDPDLINMTSFPYWIEKESEIIYRGGKVTETYLKQISNFQFNLNGFNRARSKDVWIRGFVGHIVRGCSHINQHTYTALPSTPGRQHAAKQKVSYISIVLDEDPRVKVDFYRVEFPNPVNKMQKTVSPHSGGPAGKHPRKKLKVEDKFLLGTTLVASANSKEDITTSNEKFYLMSSAVDPGTGPCIHVPKGWDLFVSTLSYGYITLVDKLQSTTQTVRLDDKTDEWQVWLASTIIPPESDISVQMFVTGSVGVELTIDHFSLTISVPGSSSLLTFGPARKVGPGKNDTIFEPVTDFLRFDLAGSSVGSTISFGDLVKFSELSSSIVFDSDVHLELEGSSAVWFSPLLGDYTSTIRLQAKADLKPGGAPNTFSFLKSLGGLGLWDEINPSSVTVVAKKTTTTSSFESPSMNINQLELILSFDFTSFSTRISCGEKSYTLAIYWANPDSTRNAVKAILDKISRSNTVSQAFQGVLDQISSRFDILRVLVEINRGSELSIRKLSIDVQLKFKINASGASSETKDIIIMLSFVWPSLIFMGDLYVPETPDSEWVKLMPSYEELLQLKPIVSPSSNVSNLSLLDLIPGVNVTNLPQGIPLLISHAAIEVDPTSFMLEGVLKAEPPSPGTALPPVSFDKLEIYLSYRWTNTNAVDTQALSLYIDALISLHPPPAGSTDPPPEPACMDDPSFLFASIEYTDGKWILTGNLRGINFGDLAIFFHKNEQSQLVDVLGNMTIRSVFVQCEFGGEGEPTTFKFNGLIAIAELELKFAYNRNGEGWKIQGWLSAANECTLGTIIKSICGDDSTDIPDAIKDIKLNIEHDNSEKEFRDSPVYLEYSKPSSKDDTPIFLLRFKLGKVQFSFVQTSSQQSGKQTVKKRILVVSLGNFLSSCNIPVIGKVDNPVDGLEFVWIQDKSKAAGLTKDEVAKINAVAFGGQTGIVFKEPKGAKAAADSDIVLTAGSHFMLLLKDSGKVTAALDYKIGGPSVKNKAITSGVPTAEDSSSDPGDVSNGEGEPSRVAVHKSVGPLSLSNIGLQYKDSKISVIIDAALTLGPIELGLLGFGLGLQLSPTLLSDPQPSDFSVQLHGLAATLNKPPIVLSGLLEDLSKENDELFAGGIAINIKAYSILAFGSYGTIKDVKTFFLYAQLVGPLFELGFATINGVSLGLGHNSHIKLPSVEEVLDFPLIKRASAQSTDASTSSSNALTILSDDVFKSWVTPNMDSFWFAAGLGVLAFHVLDVRAVAIIEIDPRVSLGVFANAVCSLPPKQPREKSYVYVELGITCRVDIQTGTFSVDGKLSPNSFILHPSCHLLGGFALYYWFDPSPYAGDFVFTLGGYHPAYTPPSYYPRPQRLSISWQLDSNLSITGDSFFAITPKVCMGGGSLSVLFQSGGLRAYLDAHAEFLMVWNPFYFIGDIGVSVGVGYRGKVLFWTVNIEIDICASLHLEGPPFCGNVHVNFWLFGFDIYFGSRPGPPPSLSLDEFWDLLSRSSNQSNAEREVGITLVVESGYVQGKNKQVTPKPGQPWVVTPNQFKFNIQCRFAVHVIEHNSAPVHNSPVSVYSKPMRTTTPLTSVLKIRIQDRAKSQNFGGFMFRPMTQNVPSAIWGRYDSYNDPSHGGTPGDLLKGDDSTIKDMLTGMRIEAPEPRHPNDNIPPFNADNATFVDVIEDKRLPVANFSPEANAWLPKETDWQGAKNAWSNQAEISPKVVAVWSKVFGWTDKLVGSPPLGLVNKLEQVYLDIPDVTSL